jgi:c-di-GMP-binding flagellar brake protein YcgR
MKELRVGQKVIIKFNISKIRSVEIECSIKWFEKDRLALNYPESQIGLGGYLHEGQEIQALIYTDNGIRIFESVVIDSPYSEDFVIEYNEKSSNVQRRDYVRTSAEFDIVITSNGQQISTKTIDIGGGGIKFCTNSEMNIGSNLDFRLYLPDMDTFVEGSGKIIYMMKKDTQMYSVFKYTSISESGRNRIIKLCFEKEASMLRKF